MKRFLILIVLLSGNVSADSLYDIYPSMRETDIEIEARDAARKEEAYLGAEIQKARAEARADAAYRSTLSGPDVSYHGSSSSSSIVYPVTGVNSLPGVRLNQYITGNR